jgi:hypothetical protein
MNSYIMPSWVEIAKKPVPVEPVKVLVKVPVKVSVKHKAKPNMLSIDEEYKRDKRFQELEDRFYKPPPGIRF